MVPVNKENRHPFRNIAFGTIEGLTALTVLEIMFNDSFFPFEPAHTGFPINILLAGGEYMVGNTLTIVLGCDALRRFYKASGRRLTLK